MGIAMEVKITEIQSTFSITYISSFVFLDGDLELVEMDVRDGGGLSCRRCKGNDSCAGFFIISHQWRWLVGNQRKIHSAKVELAGQ